MNQVLYKKLSKLPPPFYGYNKCGLPLGEDQDDEVDFRSMQADEDLLTSGRHDSLVEVNEGLLTRSMYYAQGFTSDDRLFLRKPALLQCIEYDRHLQDLGWRIRITDAYRPMEVQRKGFCWGVSEVLYMYEDLNLQEFKTLLKRAITKGTTKQEYKLLLQIVSVADQFFCYAPLRMDFDRSQFPKATPLRLIIAAANFGLIDLPLDAYSLTAHNTGGVVDLEWIKVQTGELVNMGVPVDTQGVVAAFPYFETKVATLFKKIPEFKKHKLGRISRRKRYYKKRVKEDEILHRYLSSCGVDTERFLEEDRYFNQVWNEIRDNRRVVLALASKVGMLPFGRESWHFDCNDERGGVQFKQGGKVSGPGSYALHHGQKNSAWGCATLLYEKQFKPHV